jgi:histidine triad (HIT) family protein
MASIFSKIIQGEIPADIVYEDAHVIAIKDISPVAPVHIVLFTRQEVSGVAEVDKVGDHQHLIYAAKQVAELLGLDPGYRLVINQGENGGQSIPHLHMHLIGGRKLNWPPG